MSEFRSLADVPLLSGLNARNLDALASRLRERRYRAGEVIFHQDDPGGQLHLISAGQVRISIVGSDGRERDVALLNPGECFGEMSVLDDSPRSATATAVAEVRTRVLDKAPFQEFLKANPEVALHVAIMIAKRLRQTDRMLADVFFLNVPRRVARELVQLARAIGERAPDGRVAIAIDQDELARLVGASREAVNRALSAYQEDGVLTTSRGRVEIIDSEALERATSG